ncbi:heme oxygenase [Bosea sp. TND4EK4]|nr:heme oxygenase [Bosea sp. TND4EK4]
MGRVGLAFQFSSGLRMNDLRSFLRAETHDLHEELDGLIGAFTSLDDYTRFLAGSFRHRAPAEAAIGVEADALGLGPRQLVPQLRRDLADLGLPVPAAERLVLSKDIACLLGATYVLEGSALGARVLVKSAAALGLGAAHGARYLSAQAGSITSWRELLVRLDGLERARWSLAARGARQVFDHAIQAFSPLELPAS